MSSGGNTGVDAAETGTPRAASAEGISPWWRRRWRGQAGRLEVWYATFTDRDTGTGLWLHGETVAPTDGGEATSLGWAALFPVDGEPFWSFTGRTTGVPDGPEDTFACDGLRLGPTGAEGATGDLSWSLSWDATDQRPVATFPTWAWERELLPAAQVVPAPDLDVSGWVELDGRRLDMNGHGAAARIYGHGNAHRWAWLHADLGDGNLVELVSAVSTRPVLRSLPPITFLTLRVDGLDWPSVPVAAFGLRTRLGLPEWTVRGRVRGMSVEIRVTQPPERTVSVPYADPDGATATCTNTERADLELTLRSPNGVSRSWRIEGTAHAEVGTRP